MAKPLSLYELLSGIEETIEDAFAGRSYWITAEITDVRRLEQKKWCFLKFIEKEETGITASIDAVFWRRGYICIEAFERLTKTAFISGIQVTCLVTVQYSIRHGLKLEVLEIDTAHLLGKLEMERRLVLEKLLTENSRLIWLEDDRYLTFNNTLPLPPVIKNIALVTAAGSDGQRDFKKELEHNPYDYSFSVTEFLTQVQGESASLLLLHTLHRIAGSGRTFDLVVIVRGGGSQTDLKAFDNYELAQCVAGYAVPVLTGIGHDSNTSIVDLMARSHKTPTKAAAYIVAHNMQFDDALEALKERMMRSVQVRLDKAKTGLKELKRLVKSASHETILNRGFAMLMLNGKIITDPAAISPGDVLQTRMKNETIYSTVTYKEKNEP